MSLSSRQGHTISGIEVSGGVSHFGDIYHLPGSQASESSPTPSSTILPRSDENFVDRDDLLQQVQDKATIESAWVALVGLGGVGKTQLAIRYAKSVRERADDTWILWLFAANASRFDESLHDVAAQIRLPGRQDPKADMFKLFQTWLADAAHRWVIILDNADDAAFLLEPPTSDPSQSTKRRIDYIPSCSHGSVILTSRNKDEAYKFVDEDNVIEIKPMDATAASMLLQKKLGPRYDQGNAMKLATALDFMPLALSQAASYIKQKRRYSIERYIAELEKSRHSRTSLLRQHGTVPKRDREASSSIILTWQISFEYIHNERKSAADLLALMSFCDRQAIPEFLLHDVMDSGTEDDNSRSGDDGHEETFDDDMQMLENFSFISTTTNETTWEMHRLVQNAMQWWLLDHNRLEEMKRCFVNHLYITMPYGDYENWKICEVLLPHSEIAVSDISDVRDVAIQQADILFKMAWYAWRRGLFRVAISNAEDSLRTRTKWLGHDDHDSVSSMHILASVNADAGYFEYAEELLVKVLDICKRVLGEEHINTLTSMSDLAATHSYQERYGDAEELEVKVLEIRKKVLGEEHPSTLTSVSNLALTYNDQGRYGDAEELEVKALEIRKKVLGEEHPSTLTSMNNLALMYNGLGRYGDAEELEVKALEIRKKVLGEEHPSTLTSMNNLAATFYYQRRLPEALNLMVQCVKSRSAVLGESHPHTVWCVESLKEIEIQMQVTSSERKEVNLADLTIADVE